MFRALYFKEWREKALLFFFELGILVLGLATAFILLEKKDIQEGLVYALLLLFFPFAALILGAAGFEAEQRQGAWAYLFSRPIRKSTVWLAKCAALVSMLAALWLVLVAAWFGLPGFRELAGGARVLMGIRIEAGFPYWSLWQSLFLLVIAFSLSPLHERQFNVLFLALLAGLGMTAAAWAIMISKAGGFLAWVAPEKVLPTFLVGQILTALAFAAASIMTLVRSDFSQSRKQIWSFVRWVAPMLLLAVAGTAAWLLAAPPPGDRYLFFAATSDGEPYYITDRGVFKYSGATHRIQWLARTKHIHMFHATAAGGKLAYTGFDIESMGDISEELWVANSDSSSRRRIIGRGPRENEWPREVPMAGLLLSPDGARIAILAANSYGSSTTRTRPPLWIINTDGSGFENLPDDPALFGDRSDRLQFRLLAWAKEGRAIILMRQTFARPAAFSLWLYDLDSRTYRLLLDNAMPASWISPASERGDIMAIKRVKAPESPWSMALLDLRTLAVADVQGGEEGTVQFISLVTWDEEGGNLAYIARRTRAGGPAEFVLVVYSPADGKTVAERVMTKNESSALLLWPSWAADGRKLLLLDRESASLMVLGPDLLEIERVAFPRWLESPAVLRAVGDQALIEDDKSDSLWRLDLGTKRWKRMY